MVTRSANNAGKFRALDEGLEKQAGSKWQRVAYRDLSSCVVEHQTHEGVGFALLGFKLSPEYERTRRWYELKKLNPVPVGDGEELESVLQILKNKGVKVVHSRNA